MEARGVFDFLRGVKWVLGYGAVLLFDVLANGPRGDVAPIWLAAALPGALASAASLRKEPLFGPWTLGALSLAIGLWGVAGGKTDYSHLWFFGAGAGGLLFVAEARKRRSPAYPLALLALFVALVAYFSSGHGGADPMIHWYERYGLTEDQAHRLTLAFRKTVHFAFYGTVGLTARWVLRASDAGRAEAVRGALLATLAVASFDELRQSGYANRTGSAWDVLLDLAGAAAFVGLSEWRRAKGR